MRRNLGCKMVQSSHGWRLSQGCAALRCEVGRSGTANKLRLKSSHIHSGIYKRSIRQFGLLRPRREPSVSTVSRRKSFTSSNPVTGLIVERSQKNKTSAIFLFPQRLHFIIIQYTRTLDMAPHVILIRHGEATHNVGNKSPLLTEKGVLQCEYLEKDLRSRYSFEKDSTLIIVSPAKRTLQTYHHGLKWLSDEGVPVLPRAEWQETTGNPCDICTDVAVIEKEWPSLDFSQLDPVYPAKTGLYFPSEEALQNRARFAREWLFHRPEKHIVIVTHSGFLQRVAKGQKYRNVEYKMYEFVDDASTQDFRLKEIDHGQAETLD
ncbi:hypothetical protein PG990_005892 [Apiospora arundinis]